MNYLCPAGFAFLETLSANPRSACMEAEEKEETGRRRWKVRRHPKEHRFEAGR